VSEKPFSQQTKLIGNFNTDKTVYGEDIEIKPRAPPAKKEVPNIHDGKPFVPSHPPKKGYNKSIAKFPEYKEDPLKFVQRAKPKEDGDEDKPRFKMTTNGGSRPNPSVVCNMKNLRSAYPSVFKKF
jgi:hypothetical protein